MFCRTLQLITLSDLENDFINPHDSSASLNQWVVRNSTGTAFVSCRMGISCRP